MSDTGVRPRKLWHWGAIALVVATFTNEPILTLRFAGDLFRGGGQFIGAALSDGYDNTNDHQVDDLDQEPGPDGLQAEDEGAADTTYQLDGGDVRTGLDTATDVVLALHSEVEDVQRSGGLTVEVGNGGRP